MLTKSEREKIAERANDCIEDRFLSIGIRYANLYRCLLCKSVPEDTAVSEDFVTMLTRIIDLCDTSNMIELPVDKDGIPFKKGDTVYESDGTEHKVDGYTFTGCDTKILSVVDPINNAYVVLNSDELTHKKPVTIASLVGEIRRTLSQNTIMNKEATSKLWEITDQIEMLSDSDD